MGEGPELELAKQLTNDKNIDNVQFLGNTQEVEKELLPFRLIYSSIKDRKLWFSCS